MEENKRKRSFNKSNETSRDGYVEQRKKRSHSDDDSRGERKPRRSFGENDHSERKPRRNYGANEESSERKPRRSFGDRDERTERKPRRSFGDSDERTERKPRRSFGDRDERTERKPRRSFGDRDERTERKPRRSFGDSDERTERKPRRSFGDRDERTERRPRRSFDNSDETPKRRRRDITAESDILSEIVAKRKSEGRQAPRKQKILSLEYEELHGSIRLNKYISNSGVCSRREADTLIESGSIQVNGEVVTELGTKVMPTDEVRFGDRILQREKPMYLLLNKPKDYITTMDDERDRKNVMDLVRGACKERVYPVGRLDKNTTGLLMFTNDGEMTKRLTHPRSEIKKTYYVELNKKITSADFKTISEGIELDDGIITPDEIVYIGETKREIGITIHSGKNRIVRRIFESLDYEVVKLDRVVFAGLTKKDLPRGDWRFLTEAEVNILKMTTKKY